MKICPLPFTGPHYGFQVLLVVMLDSKLVVLVVVVELSVVVVLVVMVGLGQQDEVCGGVGDCACVLW